VVVLFPKGAIGIVGQIKNLYSKKPKHTERKKTNIMERTKTEKRSIKEG
jgi:hypothetical protein